MRYTALVAFVALIAVAAALEAELPDANFASDKVKVFTSNTALAQAIANKNSVVCFFNARCTHCKAFAPEYINAAKDAPGNVQYVALDAELHGDIPMGFSFKYYPAVFYVDAAGNKIPYTDTRNAFSLSNFVKTASGSKPSLIEGDVLAHYNAMQGKAKLDEADHSGECTRTLASESASLIEASTVTAADAQAAHPSILDGEAFNADEEMMHEREASFLKQWETAAPVMPIEATVAKDDVHATAAEAAEAIAHPEAHAETEAEAEESEQGEHSLAEVDASDMDADMSELPMELGM